MDKIENKIDDICKAVGNIEKELVGIKRDLKNSDQTGKLLNDNIVSEVKRNRDRIEALEDNQRWVSRLILGLVITMVINVAMVVQYLGG